MCSADRQVLLFTVRLDMSFGRLLRMVRRVKVVAVCEVRIVGRLLMMARFMVLGGLQMVVLRMSMVLRRVVVVFRCLF